MSTQEEDDISCESSRIAILDWDGTLRPGWTLPDWVSFLVQAQVLDPQVARRVSAPFSLYKSGAIDHDRLADEANVLFAREMNGIAVRTIMGLVPNFVEEDRKRLFSFVPQLQSLLSKHHIAPVILSGAPIEILRAHFTSVASNTIIGLKLREVDGRFSGDIELDPASSAAKKQWVSRLRSKGCKIIVGIGNSSADIPVLAASQIAVVVGGDLSDHVQEHRIDLDTVGDLARQLDHLDRLLRLVGNPAPEAPNSAR